MCFPTTSHLQRYAIYRANFNALPIKTVGRTSKSGWKLHTSSELCVNGLALHSLTLSIRQRSCPLTLQWTIHLRYWDLRWPHSSSLRKTWPHRLQSSKTSRRLDPCAASANVVNKRSAEAPTNTPSSLFTSPSSWMETNSAIDNGHAINARSARWQIYVNIEMKIRTLLTGLGMLQMKWRGCGRGNVAMTKNMTAMTIS